MYTTWKKRPFWEIILLEEVGVLKVAPAKNSRGILSKIKKEKVMPRWYQIGQNIINVNNITHLEKATNKLVIHFTGGQSIVIQGDANQLAILIMNLQ